MKKLFLLLLLLPATSLAQTNTMKPLNEVIAELDEIQPHNAQYIAFRCMGLFGMIKGITDNSPKAPEAKELMEQRSQQIIMIGYELHMLENPNSDIEEYMEIVMVTVPSIADNYQIEANKSYIDTGNYFDSKFVIEDMPFCLQMTDGYGAQS